MGIWMTCSLKMDWLCESGSRLSLVDEATLWLCESASQTINNGLCEFGRHLDNKPVTDGCPYDAYASGQVQVGNGSAAIIQ